MIVLRDDMQSKVTGCMLIVTPIAWIITSFVNPESLVIGGVFFLLAFLVFFWRYSCASSGENDLTISFDSIRFSIDGRPVRIRWKELEDYGTWRKTSRISADQGGEMEKTTDYIALKRKKANGITETFHKDLSSWGGSKVMGHVAFYTPNRVVKLIKKLSDAQSKKERVEIIKNAKGMSNFEFKFKQRKIPFRHRDVLTCTKCGVMSCYDNRIPKNEFKCASCGENPKSERERNRMIKETSLPSCEIGKKLL